MEATVAPTMSQKEKLECLERLIVKAKGSLNSHHDLLTLRIHNADRFLNEAWHLLTDVIKAIE